MSALAEMINSQTEIDDLEIQEDDHCQYQWLEDSCYLQKYLQIPIYGESIFGNIEF